MSIFSTQDPGKLATYAEEAAMVDASEAVAEALEKSGMSQSDLARALGVSRSEITERLRGERNITVRKLAATLHALGATLEIRLADRPKVSAATGLFDKWLDAKEEESKSDVASATEDAAVYAAQMR